MDNKESVVKKRKLRVSTILIFFAIVTSLMGIYFASIGLPKKVEQDPYYEYEIKRNSDYTVSLKENYFYDSLTLQSGSNYPSEAVSKYHLNLTYLYESEQQTDISYNYEITADLIGDYDSTDNVTSRVWTKHYQLLNNKAMTKESSKGFSINESIVIDYPAYNSLVQSYKQAYRIGLNSYLNVKLKIQYTVTLPTEDKKVITNNDYVEVKIPLTDSVTTVNKNYLESEKKELAKETIIKTEPLFMFISLFMFGVAIALLILANKKKEVTAQTLYAKNIDKILKDYSDLIVTVKNKPDIKNLKVMELSKLDDLIDVAEQSKNNIIHYEIRKKNESFLLVITNGYVYAYVVTDEELTK